MAYPISERLLPRGVNRPGTPLRPVGVVIHETATPGATADAEARYFAGGNRDASAHYFVDHQLIIRVIPENEVAWHAGPSANRQFLSIELCHFDDAGRFSETWKRAVWLAADMCRRYGWDPDTAIHSHAWVSRTYRETDHTDPYSYFAQFGKDMDQFIADVKRCMSGGDEYMMKPEDANKIIALLGQVWNMLPDADEEGKDEIHRLANELRKASGQPVQ